jgi:hypothetical protein
MTELRRLDDTSIVSEEFLAGDVELTEADLKPYLRSTGITVDLDPLEETIEREIFEDDEIGPGDEEIDREIAPTVHRVLDLTERQASQDGIWHYLTVVHFDDFVRYRWDSDLREKFLAGGEDIYSNALHRLWWMAEITREGDDYSRTRSMLEMQELANDVADRWFARYRPITHACVDELKPSVLNQFDPANSQIASDATTRLNEKLSVVLAEGLDYDEAVALVREVRSEAAEGI